MNTETQNAFTDAPHTTLDPRAHEVLDFWFGSPTSSEYSNAWMMWFEQSDAVDEAIRSRFLSLHTEAVAGKCDTWAATPLGACALIIVLDQFSRNLYRGKPDAFAADAHALSIARALVSKGEDHSMPTPYHRMFIYLPFEHDETLESQQESMRLCEALKQETGLTAPLEWAAKHEVIIKQFGRYPHRNKILGRKSSPEEEAFLKEPNSSF